MYIQLWPSEMLDRPLGNQSAARFVDRRVSTQCAANGSYPGGCWDPRKLQARSATKGCETRKLLPAGGENLLMCLAQGLNHSTQAQVSLPLLGLLPVVEVEGEALRSSDVFCLSGSRSIEPPTQGQHCTTATCLGVLLARKMRKQPC